MTLRALGGCPSILLVLWSVRICAREGDQVYAPFWRACIARGSRACDGGSFLFASRSKSRDLRASTNWRSVYIASWCEYCARASGVARVIADGDEEGVVGCEGAGMRWGKMGAAGAPYIRLSNRGTSCVTGEGRSRSYHHAPLLHLLPRLESRGPGFGELGPPGVLLPK